MHSIASIFIYIYICIIHKRSTSISICRYIKYICSMIYCILYIEKYSILGGNVFDIKLHILYSLFIADGSFSNI
jgi:hypothetical protein